MRSGWSTLEHELIVGAPATPISINFIAVGEFDGECIIASQSDKRVNRAMSADKQRSLSAHPSASEYKEPIETYRAKI